MTQQKKPLELRDIAAVLDAQARARDPQVVFAMFDDVVQRVLGHKLLTVMRHIETAAEVERIYSSNSRAYPVGGRKAKQGSPWGAKVLDRCEVFVARNADEVREAFADYELIFSLGVTSIMNVPFVFQGRCLGTVNYSHEAGRYGEADIPTGKILTGLLLPMVL